MEIWDKGRWRVSDAVFDNSKTRASLERHEAPPPQGKTGLRAPKSHQNDPVDSGSGTAP